MNKNKKTAIWLSVLWVVSFLLPNIFQFASRAESIKSTGEYVGPGVLSSFAVVTLLMGIFYFLPLQFAVRHYAKLAKMKRLVIISNILLFILIFWISLGIVCTVLAALGVS